MPRSGRDDLLTLVAKLYYVDELDQSEIAALVNLSRSQISRVLKLARLRGIVQISVAPYNAQNQAAESRLCHSLGLQRAVVIKTVADAHPDQVRRTVGYFAAPIVSSWIQGATVIGLSGGRSVFELVSHLQPMAAARRQITAVQLMGNVGPHVAEYDAVEITYRVARLYDGLFYALSAPAIAPDLHTRNLFLAHSDMRRIWELFSTMRAAIIGIGSLEDSMFVENRMVPEYELDRLRDRGAVGEICGRFFDKDGREVPSEYHERVVSIGLDDLRRVPDVIAVTNGVRRAQVLRAAIAGRLVKSIVVDENCAEALLASG